MRCSYCGKKLRDSARFCPYCGKRNDGGSKFAEKFDSENDLLVVKSCEIYHDRKPYRNMGKHLLSVRAAAVLICIVLLCGAGICGTVCFVIPEVRYKAAEKLYSEGKLSEAKEAFSKLDGYKNSSALALKCGYENALFLMKNEDYSHAADAFTALNGYADSNFLAAECMIKMAEEQAEKGDLALASSIYAAAGKPELILPAAEKKAADLAENGDYFAAADISAEYADPDDAAEYRYLGAIHAREMKQYKTAADNFAILGDYKDSPALAEECFYSHYCSEYIEHGASEETARGFYFLGNYRDSRDRFLKCSYEYGNICLNNGDYFTAASMFMNIVPYENSEGLLYKSRYTLGTSLLESDPASARSVFALLSTYNDSAKMKKSAAEKLPAKESWYADGFTSTDGYYTSVFRSTDVMLVSCSVGTDLISQPVTLTITLKDSIGSILSADCENVRNSSSFGVSFSLTGLSAGKAEVTVSRKDNGTILRNINIIIKE